MASVDNVLTIEVIHKKLNHWNKKLNTEVKKKEKKKRFQEPIISSISKGVINVVSTVTNLVIINVKRMKKKMTKKKKQKKWQQKEKF